MRVALSVVCLLARAARADDAVPPHTAADVAGAPRPGAESGRTDPSEDGDSTARVVARSALFVPKLVVEVASAPVRGALWVTDHFGIGRGKPGAVSLAPTLEFESGFGGAVGARFSDRDTFGDNESAALTAMIGLGYRARASGAVDTGTRLAPVTLGVDGRYEHVPDLAFYGVGNSDTSEMNVDLSAARAGIDADVAIVSALHATVRGTVERVTADAAKTIDVAPELELRWDDRSAGSVWLPKSLHAAGTLARVFGARAVAFAGPDYWRYGGEVQHYWQLGRSARVLAARLYGEAVTGGDVPAFVLPALGGDTLLRGYSYDRFRDRIAAFGELQYRWDLSYYTNAYVFADAGRVYHAVDELADDHLRIGFGVGMTLVKGKGEFTADGMIGSSIDGGIVAALSFDPIPPDRGRRFW